MGSMVDKIFDKTIPGLNKMLDLHYKRSEAIISNITNAETPMYRAVDVDFAGELEAAFNRGKAEMLKTDPKHMDLSGSSQSHLVSDMSGATRADGNNVDIDIQMAKLTKNSGRYEIAARLMQKKLRIMRTAIRMAMR